MGGIKTGSGALLKVEWRIPAIQVRYYHQGDFYMPLTQFPAALADRCGYVLVLNEEEYAKSCYFDHRGSARNPRLGVPRGISKMPGYVRTRK
jgi:hypothetical protein